MEKEKEFQIENMIRYLSTKHPSGTSFSNFTDEFRKFKFYGFLSASDIPKAEYHEFTVDFTSKSIEAYSYDISYHNGDHYNCSTTNISWDSLESIFDKLKAVIEPLAYIDETIKIKKEIIKKRTEEILKGNY